MFIVEFQIIQPKIKFYSLFLLQPIFTAWSLIFQIISQNHLYMAKTLH